jgi:hypothetical protein
MQAAMLYLIIFVGIIYISLNVYKRKFNNTVYISAIFLTTLLITSFFASYQIDPHHDGIMMKPAVDVASGQMLFRDTFSQYGALSTIVQAASLKVFGYRLIVLRKLTALFYCLTAILLWLIYSRLLSKLLNIVLFFTWTGISYYFIDYGSMTLLPWSTVFCVFTFLLAIYLLIKYIEQEKGVFIFFSGAAVSCIFWFKINFGITSLIIFFPAILLIETFPLNLKKSFKNLLFFFLGWSVITSIFLIWLSHNNAMNDFWLQSVKFAQEFSRYNWDDETNYPLPVKVLMKMFQIKSEHSYSSWIWTMIPLICVFYVLKTFRRTLKKKIWAKNDKTIFVVSLLSSGMWVNYFPVDSIFHMYFAVTPMLGMTVYFIWDAAKGLKYSKRLTAFIIIFTIFFAYDISMRLGNAVNKSQKILESEGIKEPAFLKGMRVSSQEAENYKEMSVILNNIGMKNGIINISNAGLYPLFDRSNKNFHKMYVDWGWANNILYPDYLAALETKLGKNNCPVISGNDVLINNYVTVKIFPPLGCDFAERVVISKPGRQKNIFLSKGASILEDPVEKNKYTIEMLIKTDSEVPVNIDNIVVYVLKDELDVKRFAFDEFNYDILPKTANEEDRQVLIDSFTFMSDKNIYCLKKNISKQQREKIANVFLNLSFYGKNFVIADSYNEANTNRLDIYKNGIMERDPGIKNFSGKDRLKITVRLEKNERNKPSLKVKARINYNSGLYSEMILKN